MQRVDVLRKLERGRDVVGANDGYRDDRKRLCDEVTTSIHVKEIQVAIASIIGEGGT